MSGLATINGRKSDPPTLVGSAVVDCHTSLAALIVQDAISGLAEDDGRLFGGDPDTHEEM